MSAKKIGVLGCGMIAELGHLPVLRFPVKAKQPTKNNRFLVVIFSFSVLFNLMLLPSWPSLSDDMFRYVWDGRVQAAGVNPYRFEIC